METKGREEGQRGRNSRAFPSVASASSASSAVGPLPDPFVNGGANWRRVVDAVTMARGVGVLLRTETPMTRQRRGRFAVSEILLFLIALPMVGAVLGCGGSGDSGTGTGTSATDADGSRSSGGSAGAARPRSGGLKVARIPIRTDGPKSLDPAQGSTTYDNQACSLLYEPLLEYEYLLRPTDATTIRPLLLTEMPTVSDDGLVYTFRIKPGVRFHDDPCFPQGQGRELTAKDVEYSWKRLADDRNRSKSWWLLQDTIVGLDEFRAEQNAKGDAFDYEAPVEGLRVVSDSELVVTLKEPVYRFIYTLTMFQLAIVPREAIESYGDRFSRHPVGTGPFMMQESAWVQGKSMVVDRNPNYHETLYPSEGMPEDIEKGLLQSAGRRLPLLDRVEITMFVEDQPMWLTFRTKQIDFTQVPAENFDEAFVKRGRRGNRTFALKEDFANERIDWAAVPLLDFIFYGFNMDDPLLGGHDEKRRKLRQALSLAMDWDERNDTFYNGINAVFDGPLPVGIDGHPADGRAPISYRGPDLQRAKQLLAEAGYPDGAGLPAIEFYTATGGNNAEQVDMLVRHMSQLGVEMRPKMVDFSSLIQAVNDRSAPWFSFAWGTDYPDPENNLALFYGPNASPGSNHFNYVRPEYDEMYRQLRTMGPSPERTALVERMRDMLIEDAPYAGSMGRTRFYLVNPRLKNFKPTEDFYNWVKYLDVAD